MNPNAKSFVFNPSASTFVPPALPTPPESTPAAPLVVEQLVEEEETEEEEIDEDDPLWKATLSLNNGDRKAALKMLEDPDTLMQHPEIKKIMDSGSLGEDDEDDWEKSAPAVEAVPEVVAKVAAPILEKKDPVVEAVVVEEEIAVIEAVEGDPREHLNLVFIGHVDAGKSTLSGSILYLMGKVDQRTVERFEREAKQRNRESWFLAFIMDTSEEERAKGKTVEVGRAHFETDTNRYTILDAPGHKNYVPNMIAGATQADVGVLVISARKGEFETGFEKGGQTREHALLAKTLGVQYLVVVINKMDDPTVLWEQERYDECVSKLKPYLKQVGYVIKTEVKFIPISGLSGDNVLNEVKEATCNWWKPMYSSGANNTTTATLIGTLDALRLSGRIADGPLRIPCLDRYYETGTVVMGKVESGSLRMGDEITVCPTLKKAKVKEITIDEVSVSGAKPGENVLIKLHGLNVEDIQKGYVLCQGVNICPMVTAIKVQLFLIDMLEHRPLFSPGYDAMMHCHTTEIECTCAMLLSVQDKGKWLKRPFGRTGQICTAVLKVNMRTCMDSFEKMPSMGRLTLRDEGKTIAIGKILEVIENKKKNSKDKSK